MFRVSSLAVQDLGFGGLRVEGQKLPGGSGGLSK